MSNKKNRPPVEVPSVAQLEKELQRERYRRNYGRVLRSTLFTLVSVAAVAILIAMLFMPVLQIYGSSMSPCLEDGDIVVTVKRSDFQQGDVISFYYNNKILVKRVIAFPGDWVNMDAEGNVFVNGQKLDEPYLADKAYGDVNIQLPYQVPEGKYFVMGDHRSTSADSRNTAVGCVAEEQIVGKMVLRVWPFRAFGTIE
ncbi:MAG: signal peptidase I [Clostridia bacterium]|nr:signal peptidase I [Clostridia bacterium]